MKNDMLTIQRFEIPAKSEFVLRIPDGASILGVHFSHIFPEIHAIVDLLNPAVYRRFRLLTTGFEVPELILDYVGAFLRNDRIFHLFEDITTEHDTLRNIRCRTRCRRPL